MGGGYLDTFVSQPTLQPGQQLFPRPHNKLFCEKITVCATITVTSVPVLKNASCATKKVGLQNVWIAVSFRAFICLLSFNFWIFYLLLIVFFLYPTQLPATTTPLCQCLQELGGGVSAAAGTNSSGTGFAVVVLMYGNTSISVSTNFGQRCRSKKLGLSDWSRLWFTQKA